MQTNCCKIRSDKTSWHFHFHIFREIGKQTSDIQYKDRDRESELIDMSDRHCRWSRHWQQLSNSSPTCKPNSTLVGLSRSWLCFPTEGRRRKEEEGRNHHLAFRRRIEPTCLNFGDCLEGVWRVYGNCLEGVWRVSGGCLMGFWWMSGGCLEGVLRVSGRCLEGVWRVSMGCLNGNLVSQD